MGIVRLFLTLVVVPGVAIAEDLSLTCAGTDPNWSLHYDGNTAEFSFTDRTSTLDVPQKSTAEGAEWPKAATLIGPRDSAIIVIHRRACETMDYEMQVLTQRGETPLLLTGCCISE